MGHQDRADKTGTGLPILPMVFLLGHIWGLYHMACTNMVPPRKDFLPTLACSIPWVLWFLVKLFLVSRGGRRVMAGLAIALTWIVPLGSHISPPFPLSLDQLRLFFEISILLWVFLLAIHCSKRHGWLQTMKFFGVGVLYGSMLENAGIYMDCFWEEGYRLYLPGMRAPLATMLGWSATFYVSIQVAHILVPSRHAWWLRGLLATGISLGLDGQLDPVATANAWWTWHPSLPPFFYGVPLLNFVAWFYACSVFYLFHEWLAWKYPPHQTVRILAWSLLPICAVAFLGVVITMGLIEGWSGPSLMIFRGFFLLPTG